MAGFLAPLSIQELDGDERHWRLLEPCIYHLRDPHGEEWVEAPAGMITDFGSIPRAFWNLRGLSPFGTYRRAYVIHDTLFVAPVVRTQTHARAIGFAEANAILIEAMQVLGAGWWVRAIVRSGVSTGGWFTWRRYRQADRAA